MIKRLILLLALAVIFITGATRVFAAALPIDVYVDTAWKGSESGTKAEPYNTEPEAKWAAQNAAGGGYVHVKQGDNWDAKVYYVRPIFSGATGTPLADVTLYALLAVLALALLLVGWQFQKRSRQLQN